MNQYLKSFSTEAQIGILFVLLFGVLTILTIVLLLADYKHQVKQNKLNKIYFANSFWPLIRQSWVMAIMFWLSWILGHIGATILFGLVSFIVLREFISASSTHRGDHYSLFVTFFIICPLQFWLAYSKYFIFFSILIPVYVFFTLPVLSAFSNNKDKFLERNSQIQWGIMVCIYGLSHVPALYMLHFPNYNNKNAFLVFFLIATVQTALILQHIFKKYLYKINILKDGFYQKIRPSVFASLGCAICCGLFAGITPFKPGQAFAIGLVTAVLALLGQFLIKIILSQNGLPLWQGSYATTGSTGYFTKLGALCFAAPLFFHSVRWYFDLTI
jgi:phosphatidate cytidylyltransferase